MDLQIMFDYIGHYGPLISFFLTGYSLLNRKIYAFVFACGSFLNLAINMWLKAIFREPRPQHPVKFIDSDDLVGSNSYGMPSGHAQITFFSLTFLLLTKSPILWIYIMTCIAVITVYQRWKYKRHTVKQLIVGAGIGIFSAWIIVMITDTYLQDIISHK